MKRGILVILFGLVCGGWMVGAFHGCVMGDTGPCESDTDCAKYGPAKLYCSRHWCVPKFIRDWVQRQDAKRPDGGVSERVKEHREEFVKPERPTPEQPGPQVRACFPHGKSGCELQTKQCKGACQLGKQTCIQLKPDGHCVQWNSCQGAVTPLPEKCGDNIDNDCDGAVDESDCVACYSGESQVCYDVVSGCVKGNDGNYECKGLCRVGKRTCQEGKYSECTGMTGPKPEVCENQKDENCDGEIDSFCVTTLSGVHGSAGAQDSPGKPTYNAPQALAVWEKELYVADTGNGRLRQLLLDKGTVTTLNDAYQAPQGLAFDKNGALYIADTGKHAIKILKAGTVEVFAGSKLGESGAVDDVSLAARFHSPRGLAFDDQGNLYVADTGNHTIRKITPSKQVSTLTGKAGEPGTLGAQPETLANARFNQPYALACDGKILFVADLGNNAIRKIDLAAQTVTTIPGPFKEPKGLALDKAGNLYIADSGNHVIRRWDRASGKLTLFAGEEGTGGTDDGAAQKYLGASGNQTARFLTPHGLAFGRNGYLYIADSQDHTIRVIVLPLPE